METSLEKENLTDDEKNEIEQKFESLYKRGMNDLTGSMFQLFFAHDIIEKREETVPKDFVKRAISSETQMLTSTMYYISDEIETYAFDDVHLYALRGIEKQFKLLIDLFDEEYKKIV